MSITVSKTFDTESEAIAWLNGGSAETSTSTAKTTKAETSKPAAKTASKPKVTQEQMQAALTKVKDTLGVPAAKGIINETGGVKKMDDIPEDKYAAVIKACEEKLTEAEAENGDNGEDDGI